MHLMFHCEPDKLELDALSEWIKAFRSCVQKRIQKLYFLQKHGLQKYCDELFLTSGDTSNQMWFFKNAISQITISAILQHH